MIDETHDPSLTSWVESANAPNVDFPIQNLPFVTFRRRGETAPRLGAGIGDRIFDLASAVGVGAMADVFAMPRAARKEMRKRISGLLRSGAPRAEQLLTDIPDAELLLPCPIGDYTDFYASVHHATNVGSMFRPDNPLLPNYKWVPVAYHGRASSVVVSGTPVRRPWGQTVENPGGAPVYGPTQRLDYELELGAFLGPGSRLGEPVVVREAEDHIAGVCLLNDWSARDIQAWEYQPLGPFLAKNFATSISPWVIPLEALEPFRAEAEPRAPSDPQPLPHLAGGPPTFDIQLEVLLRTARMAEPTLVSRASFTSMYWTLAQMVAHHTSNGCNIRAGDLIGSGTVSGSVKSSRGCLLELTWRGSEPLVLPSGEDRRFLQDGDEVILRGWCDAEGFRRIGLGECRGRIES